MINIKKNIYYSYLYLRSQRFYQSYKHLVNSHDLIPPETTNILLIKQLLHCQKSVVYYSKLMNEIADEELLQNQPEKYIQKLPILTKDIIQTNFQQIKSNDLNKRRWYTNTSGGSTGEPIQLIQDIDYMTQSSAITSLYSYLVGKDLGESEVRLWGSERDIFKGSLGWKAQFFNFLTNTTYLNAFKMSPESMKEFIKKINQKSPKLIVAYAQAIYELAKFAESEKIAVIPQKAIMTSAGTLYPWMREKIESVFKCKLYNRYGSREVGDIACERPGVEGLWIAPWGHYLEIVDDEGKPLPAGIEGNILITCLTNYAMPLIRYKIGDRGSLAPASQIGQLLQRVSGRNVDSFKTENGTLIDGEYFTHLLYFKEWVKKFQVIQRNIWEIDIKIVLNSDNYKREELEDIVNKCKIVMGDKCKINFEFINEISPSQSGKYRYTISEIN